MLCLEGTEDLVVLLRLLLLDLLKLRQEAQTLASAAQGGTP